MLACISVSAASEGTCGDSVAWQFGDDGKLTVSGSGAMDNWSNGASVPWYSCRGSIKTVVILDGVTSIGSNAFYNCTKLTSVNIPDSVTTIGNHAFNRCSGLTGITIPKSVTSIGASAFASCSTLSSITISDGVVSIGEKAFSGCSGLTSVKISKSLSSIGAYAFENCKMLTSVYITDLEAWCRIKYSHKTAAPLNVVGGDLYIDDMLAVDIVIPEGITSINGYAFSGCSSIKSVTIPDSVTSIGTYAFLNCSSLEKATIPKSVTDFGRSVFSNTSADFTIHGFTDSEAETYAENNSHNFTVITDWNGVVGDADGDGRTNSVDLVYLQRYLAGWTGYDTAKVSLPALDLNLDSAINADDATILARYIAKWKGYETLPISF